MLKIKDNVNMQRLLQYGFRYKGIGMIWKLIFTLKDADDYTISIWIDDDDANRIINIKNDNYDCNFSSCIPNVIYDLIQDGLVEKIEEGEDK